MMEHAKRRLRTWVHVPYGDQDHGTWFGPDDDLPEWAAAKLADNPQVWADEDDGGATPAKDPSWLMGHEFKPGAMISSPAVTPGHYEGGNP